MIDCFTKIIVEVERSIESTVSIQSMLPSKQFAQLSGLITFSEELLIELTCALI